MLSDERKKINNHLINWYIICYLMKGLYAKKWDLVFRRRRDALNKKINSENTRNRFRISKSIRQMLILSYYKHEL